MRCSRVLPRELPIHPAAERPSPRSLYILVSRSGPLDALLGRISHRVTREDLLARPKCIHEGGRMVSPGQEGGEVFPCRLGYLFRTA